MIELEIAKCQRCPLHCNIPYGCTPMIGEGNIKSGIVIVVQNPPLDNILIKSPLEYTYKFYLKNLLGGCGLKDSDYYITCLVKCNTEKAPKLSEIQECSSFLLREIENKKVVGCSDLVCKHLKKMNIPHLALPSINKLFTSSKLKENAVRKEIIEFISK